MNLDHNEQPYRRSTPQDSAAPVLLRPLHRQTLSEGITLIAAPRVVVSWQEFIATTPKYSLALDGIVWGQTQFDENGPRANFNHHEEVARLPTRSTCGQIYLYLMQNMLDPFTLDGDVKMSIYVNDCDQDTSLSVWLLKNWQVIKDTKREERIRELVMAEDHLDATGGAFPYNPHSRLMQQINWIFEPYSVARAEGRISTMNGAELCENIRQTGERINAFSLGRAELLPLDLRYKKIGGGPKWAMIRETGNAARTALLHDKIYAFVAVRDNPDGSYTYSIGKMTSMDPFPITELYAFLNELEGLDPESDNCWGGSTTIGGSPRQTGSKLSPKQLESAINRFLEMRLKIQH